MIPLRIEGATHVYRAPRGLKGEVRDLHVAIIDGCCVSRWEPTPDELAILNAGGTVELWLMGQQPPVALRAAPKLDPLPVQYAIGDIVILPDGTQAKVVGMTPAPKGGRKVGKRT